MSQKVKALYGFSPAFVHFVDKTPVERVSLLASWGCTAVFGGYEDPAFVEAVHAAGLKIYAELGCFVGQRWWERVPASRPITRSGEPLTPEGWYYGVNPANETVREAQLTALGELLQTHDLDGVWLDFIRWPCRWEGSDPHRPFTSFDAATLTKFCHDSGIDLPIDDPISSAELLLTRHEAAWTAWRCQQITDWVAQAREVVQSIKPEATLGLFSIPWRLADFEGALLKIMGQDLAALADSIDVFSPMVYHLMCGQPPHWIDSVVSEVSQVTGKPVWPIVQSVDKPAQLSPEAYDQALEVALNCTAASGVLVFNMKDALQPAKLTVLQNRFE